MVLLSFVLPVLVEPVFNKFTPMPDSPLRTELMALAARDGVPVRDVLVADASRRTRAVNAYVSGFGPTRRVVVYDTLLREATPAEVAAVVAHELGHAKDRDVLTGTITGALGAAGGGRGGLPARLGHGPAAAGRGRLDRRAAGVAAAAGTGDASPAWSPPPLRPSSPAGSRPAPTRTPSRSPATRQTFEAMQRRLSAVNLADPDPPRWEHLYAATHPSTVERMAAARAYARMTDR